MYLLVSLYVGAVGGNLWKVTDSKNISLIGGCLSLTNIKETKRVQIASILFTTENRLKHF